MPSKRKLSGAELLAELGDTLDHRPTSPPATSPAPPTAPGAQGGRPSKVAGRGVPLTVRFSEETVAALRRAALARTQETEGRVMVTPQDVVRELIDRAMAEEPRS